MQDKKEPKNLVNEQHQNNISAQVEECGKNYLDSQQMVNKQIPIDQLLAQLNDLRSTKMIILTKAQYQSSIRLQQLNQLFTFIKNEFNSKVNEILQIIEGGLKRMIQRTKNDIELLTSSPNKIIVTQVEQQVNELQIDIAEIYNQYQIQDGKIRYTVIQQYLEHLKTMNQQIKLNSVWKNQEDESKKLEFKCTLLKEELQIQDRFGQYKMLSEKEGIQLCWAFAMNKDETILASGSNHNIQLWNYSAKGTLTLKQTLIGHTDTIQCLCFSKFDEWFISGGRDNSIRIWKKELKKDKWVEFQILEEHKHWINSVVLNNDEDELLSCSDIYDKTIKIWIRQINNGQWQCKQTLKIHTSAVYFLSFTPDCELFASYGYDKIIIWNKSKDRLWQQYQAISDQKNDRYLRGCLISETELIATTVNGNLCILIAKNNGSFIMNKQLLLNENIEQMEWRCFPFEYNRQMKIAICRHSSQFAYLLIKQQDAGFLINQVFKGDYRARQLTKNGRHLILGNEKTKKIEIWELK